MASTGEENLIFSPLTCISPESGWIIPYRIFIKVDFPAPFSPQIAWISPCLTTRLMSSFAMTPGKDLVIPDNSTAIDTCTPKQMRPAQPP